MFSIMIVEDDDVIASSLQEELIKWNYDVHKQEDFTAVMDDFIRIQPQLVLMDIQLPSCNGYHWCQEIRRMSEVPVIFISSRTDDMDLVMAIQMGADDYIQKPFQMTVVVAKIQAMLRRTYDFSDTDHFYSASQVILKPSELNLIYKDKKASLTGNEMRIMEILFKHKGEYVSKELIMRQLWEDEAFIDSNTLAVNIARLRKKLKAVGKDNFILTKKGVGYAIFE
ncbi:DNA-binding response regulator, OmpR family, contains REC and winged-helix (wHTH) domain [Alkalibacterium subtropicum]|uniref:DNA-binding response regulator, OmpR family, contains REC and winged-helix (WHTH) domain n=1 Tax=Alkalibacterium subtropicum TaxID=753702 RepID=A0A1I1FPT0_9LACT|nr:response regulator transcription factor [Alkalibacterium subtropicum]SFB99083.1 DNA-binding response regulator, OmpR family, contains REC and winged-helix (wHTH) domain [Alkalibacterium subtropicum]